MILKPLMLFPFFLLQASVTPHPIFRWDVKTLTDNSGIDWMLQLEKTKNGRLASIEGLTKKAIQFTNCGLKTKNTRRSDEKRVVKLRVKLVKVKRETNDNDYHIVIQSLTNKNHQMVAEIPDSADDVFSGSIYADIKQCFAGLRTQVDSLLGDNVTTAFKNFPPNTIITIYGIPFWDCQHPGEVSGASKDFREIHPVLEIKD